MIKTYINGVLKEEDILSPADRTKLDNLSGINTGDETASTIITKIGDGSKINSNYLPSYVDDVLEYANLASFPVTGEVGKIYIALDVNLTYRWGGSAYVEISPSIALGETSATAYRGDRGASAYAHSILTSGTNPHNTTFANIVTKPTTVAGYGITDGVTLTGTQTLTNKTLTSPVLNTEVTGTGVTTTGGANKIVKTSSLGNISMTQSVDGHMLVGINNTSSGLNADCGYTAKSNNDSSLIMYNYGSGRTATLMGKPIANKSGIFSYGVNDTGILFGTLGNTPITIGINSLAVADINATESAWSIPLKTTQFKLSALNTAPASPTATGTAGEVRVGANGIYYCTATNTWRKAIPVTVSTETITGLTSTFTNSTLPGIERNIKYRWFIESDSSGGVIESTHNLYAGNNILSLVTGATVATVTANSVYSMRIGNSVLEIKFDTGNGAVSYRIASGTITEIKVQRLQQRNDW